MSFCTIRKTSVKDKIKEFTQTIISVSILETVRGLRNSFQILNFSLFIELFELDEPENGYTGDLLQRSTEFRSKP